jgi:hypothetical protein
MKGFRVDWAGSRVPPRLPPLTAGERGRRSLDSAPGRRSDNCRALRKPVARVKAAQRRREEGSLDALRRFRRINIRRVGGASRDTGSLPGHDDELRCAACSADRVFTMANRIPGSCYSRCAILSAFLSAQRDSNRARRCTSACTDFPDQRATNVTRWRQREPGRERPRDGAVGHQTRASPGSLTPRFLPRQSDTAVRAA